MKINKHIEIVRSTVISQSSMSLVSAEAICTTLKDYYSAVGITTVNNLQDLKKLVAMKPDLVFLGMEFVHLESSPTEADPLKIWLSAYFDTHNILYTGSAQTTMEAQRFKHVAKKLVLDAGLATAPFFIAGKDTYKTPSELPLALPLFIKPFNLGGGTGIDSDSVVTTFEEYIAKVSSISTRFRADSLVEEYLPGREFSVALLQNASTKQLLAMPIELIAEIDERGNRVLGVQAKKSDNETVLFVTDTALRHKLTILAEGVFIALGARDFGRIDIRLDRNNEPQFLEANLIPSLIKGYGNFPKACLINMDIDYCAMLLKIVGLALTRHRYVPKLQPAIVDITESPTLAGALEPLPV